MDLVFFLLPHSASLRYPLPFLIFELCLSGMGCFFFRVTEQKGSPGEKFAFFITIILLIIVGAGIRKANLIRDDEKMGVSDQNLFAGVELGSSGFLFCFFFPLPLSLRNIDLLAFCWKWRRWVGHLHLVFLFCFWFCKMLRKPL